MSWRSLVFVAVVIAVLFGVAESVFSTGTPDRAPTESGSNPRRTDQELIDRETFTPYPMTSEELARCPVPTDLPEEATGYVCVYEYTPPPFGSG